MHDPTEGGLSGGLHELAAAGVGFEIDEQAIPVLPECARICESLGLDPLGLIASGSLLATVDPGDAPAVVDSLRNSGIESRVIGSANTRSGEVTLRTRSGVMDFPPIRARRARTLLWWLEDSLEPTSRPPKVVADFQTSRLAGVAFGHDMI